MDILIIGAGGREHALAWRLAKSPGAGKLWCAPGNAGTAEVAENVDCAADDVDGLVALAERLKPDLVVVGPEKPLGLGLGDRLRGLGFAVFGPDAAAARLETSKAFTKAFCDRHGVPTAAYGVFEDMIDLSAFIDGRKGPYVLKADGLASGKGVVIAETRQEAKAEADAMLGGRHGAASKRVIVEEFMAGEEASFFVLSDGETFRALPACQDHKRKLDGDKGPNTGGMGAYCPAPALTPELEAQAIETIVRPTLAGIAAEGAPYAGVLYVGLMLTDKGPKVVEFNVRFGDPECQVLMARLDDDLAAILHACATGALADAAPIGFDPRPAVTVVMAAEGYPGAVEKGSAIAGVEAAGELDGVVVFHAGTARGADGVLRANGGRVLNVTALGDNLAHAARRAYQAVDLIDWPEGFHRRDIAWRALERAD